MIVDPIRHLTDIGALVAIFMFAYALAWMIARVSASGDKTGKGSEKTGGDIRSSPAPTPANDSSPPASGASRVDVDRLAA
jgi:hypothetical protein